MKKLFPLLLCICVLHTHAQITFDDATYKSYVFIDTVNYRHNLWQVGQPHKTVFTSAYSAPNVIVTDTAHPYRANDTSVFVFKVLSSLSSFGPRAMPFIYVINFWYQLDLDTNARATLEISTDSGFYWRNILKDTTGVFDWSFSGGTKPDFDTSTHGWTYFSVSFMGLNDSLIADTTMFRFTFSSASNDSGRDGWMVDNLWVEYYTEGYVPQVGSSNQILIYPNPATTSLTISSTQNINSITITNLLGQTVYNEKMGQCENVQINVADLPTGIYFVKVNLPTGQAGGTEVRKFVKE